MAKTDQRSVEIVLGLLLQTAQVALEGAIDYANENLNDDHIAHEQLSEAMESLNNAAGDLAEK